MWAWDIASGVVQWDATMEGLCGLEPGAFGSTYDAWLATLHPDERATVTALVEQAVADRTAYAVEHRVVWPDGTERWLECRGRVLTDAAGAPTGTVGCAFDITERKRSEAAVGRSLTQTRVSRDRLAGLQRLSRRLAEAISVADIVAAVFDVLETPVPTASRAVWLVDAVGGHLELVDQVGLAPDAVAAFGRIDLSAPLPGAIACREQRTIVAGSGADAVAAFPALDGVRRSAPGFIAVPLCTESTSIGVLALGYDGDLDDDDIVFVETAAGQVALALARTMLTDALAHRAEDAAAAARDAAAAAERERRARQHFEFLATVAQAVMRSESHDALMHSVAQVTVPMLGDWCSVHFVPEPGAAVQVAVAHSDAARAEWARRVAGDFPYDPTGGHGVAQVLATGATEFDPSVDPERASLARGRVAGTDAAEEDEAVRSVLTVPLTSQGRTVGALQYVRTWEGSPQDADDVTLAEAVGERIGDALMIRWQAEQHRQISVTLQRAFLPPRLPEVAGFDLAARYLPVGETADVGGDFYDVFPLDEGCWAIVIGDVCGTGADAAATASIVRHTVRAAARHGHDHASVVDWANHAVLHSGRDLFCTMCFATIELGDGDAPAVLRVASAGHPLPIARRASGAVELGGYGTLLGVFEHIDIITETVELAAGDAVVVYTDGVSDLPPPHGVRPDELVQLVGATTVASADALVDALVSDLAHRTSAAVPRDDVALLALRCQRGPATVDERPLLRSWQRDFPAEHTSIRAARRYARDAVTDAGVDAGALELAVSELVSNAVLHARTPCTVRVEQHRDSVRVEVTDHDPRPPQLLRHDPERVTGRGLRIVDAVVDRWDVDAGADGKTVWFELAVPTEDAA